MSQEDTRLVVRSELDRILMPNDAPLVLPDSERMVVTAVLSGRVKHDQLPPLEGRHFAIGAWGVLWEASRETLEPVNLHMAVIGAGYPSVSPDIAEMFDYGGPLPSIGQLTVMASRITDSWRRRTLATELGTCKQLLAAEAISIEDTIERLRVAVKVVRCS